MNFTNSANILAAVKITVKLLHFFHPKDNQILEPIIIYYKFSSAQMKIHWKLGQNRITRGVTVPLAGSITQIVL